MRIWRRLIMPSRSPVHFASANLSRAAAEGDELDARARRLAAELGGWSQVAEDAGREPAADLDGLQAWAEVARAGLFVARGQLASQREGIVRQANEIGAVALGEPLTSASAAVVTRRVRRSLRGAGAES